MGSGIPVFFLIDSVPEYGNQETMQVYSSFCAESTSSLDVRIEHDPFHNILCIEEPLDMGI